MPLVLRIDTEEEIEEGREKTEKHKEKKRRSITRWDEKAWKIYIKKTEEAKWTDAETEEHIEEKWGKLKNIIEKVLVKKQVNVKSKELGHKDW